jgi:hypothetical protein
MIIEFLLALLLMLAYSGLLALVGFFRILYAYQDDQDYPDEA